jgi:hypothetical protein
MRYTLFRGGTFSLAAVFGYESPSLPDARLPEMLIPAVQSVLGSKTSRRLLSLTPPFMCDNPSTTDFTT